MPKHFDTRNATRRQNDPRLLDTAGRLLAKGVSATAIVRLVGEGKTPEQIEAMYDDNPQPQTTQETDQ